MNSQFIAMLLFLQDLHMTCYILYAAGYAETSVEQAKAWLEKAGIEVRFLGLRSGFIAGAMGGVRLAEALISKFTSKDEDQRPLPDGLLLAGGVACGRQLLTDPRVHLLLNQMGQAAKPVGFLYPVSYPFVTFLQQQLIANSFLLQEEKPPEKFIAAFLQQLNAVQPTLPT